MNFSDNFLFLLILAFFGWLYYQKKVPTASVNASTAPFWYTSAYGQTKQFGFAGQAANEVGEF